MSESPPTPQADIIVSARINEYATRGANPHIPYTPQEIAADAAACAEAGAAVVHFHAREADGAPTMSADVYVEIVERIRERCDVVLMPTLGAGMPQTTIEARMGHVRALAARGLAPELAPIDLATTNIDVYDAEAKAFRVDSMTYENTAATLRELIEELEALGVTPLPVAWNLSSVRLLGAFIDSGVLSTPLLTELTLSEGLLAGHPPSAAGLRAYLDFLPARCAWSVLCYGAPIVELLDPILEQGGHVSVGLGDHPYPELGNPSNAALVERVIGAATQSGRAVASPADVRQLLGVSSVG